MDYTFPTEHGDPFAALMGTRRGLFRPRPGILANKPDYYIAIGDEAALRVVGPGAYTCASPQTAATSKPNSACTTKMMSGGGH